MTFVKRDGQFYKHYCHIYVYLHFFKSADFDCNIQKSTVKLRPRNRKKLANLPILCLRNTENDNFFQIMKCSVSLRKCRRKKTIHGRISPGAGV